MKLVMRKYSRIFENTLCFHNLFLFHISLMWPKLLNADGEPLAPEIILFLREKKTNNF
jgi:hypothetical protein